MKTFCLGVDPGICGFICKVKCTCEDGKTARIDITDSGCTMIQELAGLVAEITFQEFFVPLTQNKIFLGAEKAGCHLACPVPVAVVKASEAALTLALPKDVAMRFES